MLAAVPALFERSRYSCIRSPSIAYLSFFILAFLFVGLRYQVGSDWYGYERIFEFGTTNTLAIALTRSEPGYMLLNWLSAKLGLSVVFVNLICAVIAISCCFKFCSVQNRPWLAAFITASYMLVVIVMGLTRQGVAVSIFLLSLTFLFQGKRASYLFGVLFASAFHSSALITLPLLAFTQEQGRLKSLVLFGVFLVGVVAYAYFVEMNTLQDHYFSRELSSSGAYPRFVFHVLAATLFFTFYNRIQAGEIEKRIYKLIALSVFVLFAALFITPSSTAIDRLAFYTFPLQIFLFCNLPNILGKERRLFAPALVGVIFLYYAKIIIWFLIGSTSDRFIPYTMTFWGLFSEYYQPAL